MKKQRFSPRIAANGLVLKTETQHHRQHSNNSRKGVVALATETEMKTRDSGDGRSSETNCSKIVCGLPPDGGGMACIWIWRGGKGWDGEGSAEGGDRDCSEQRRRVPLCHSRGVKELLVDFI